MASTVEGQLWTRTLALLTEGARRLFGHGVPVALVLGRGESSVR